MDTGMWAQKWFHVLKNSTNLRIKDRFQVQYV